MDHADLISEMPRVEQMATQERLLLARRQRMQQLKVWQQREKEYQRKPPRPHKSAKPGIVFNDSVVLIESAARNDIDEVRRLLMKGVNPDSCNEDGLTALHQCCIDNNEAMLLLLLEYGANINAEDSEKWTPLHAAATCGHLELVRILIARSANLLAVNADGNMPYDICEDETVLDHIEGEMARRGVTQRLIDDTRAKTETIMLEDMKRRVTAKMDVEYHDAQGATPLHIAAANGYISVAEFLLNQKVRTDVKDKDDWQPAHAAACWGHLEVLELLVQFNADLDAKNKHDERPEDICEDRELKERISQLKVEQETRLKAQAHKNKQVRRSQSSSNPRTHSVRRTSIRDKELTTKRDAVEEARIRTRQNDPGIDIDDHKHNSRLPPTQPTSLPPHQNGLSSPPTSPTSQQNRHQSLPPLQSNTNNTQSDVQATRPNNLPSNDNNNSTQPPSLIQQQHREGIENRRAPEGKDNELELHGNGNNGVVVKYSPPGSGGRGDGLVGSGQTSPDVNGKVTVVHVVVTINGNGTLADLKKQRAQIRSNNGDVSGLNSPIASITDVSNNSMVLPNSEILRFTGDTMDDNMTYSKPKRCCTIM